MSRFEELAKVYYEAWNEMTYQMIIDHFVEKIRETKTVGSIVWNQYQQYFNDGDTCGYYVYAEPDLFETIEDGEDWTFESPEWAVFKEECQMLADEINGYDDLLEDHFDPDNRITVNRDGTYKMEEFTDHD